MGSFLAARRTNDAVVSACQDNEKKIVLILDLNETAEELLKYKKENLLNKPLIDVFSIKTKDYINDYLDYTETGHDLFDVVPRIINFSLVNSDGENILAKIKVFRTTQFVNNKINYELLIRDISLFHKLEIFRTKCLAGKKYKNHGVFNILNNDSTALELSIVSDFAFWYQINLAVGIVSLSSEYNTESSLNFIIEHFYKNCRNDDFIGYINDNKILFILFDCNAKYTTNAVKRIYSAINRKLSQQKLSNISITYKNVSTKTTSIELIKQLNIDLSKKQPEGIFKVD